MDAINLARFARGRVCGCCIPNGLPVAAWPPGEFVANAAVYDAAVIVAKLLRGAPDGKDYKIGGMYLEFDNSGAAVNPVPVVSREGSLAYYLQLHANSPTRDYLRVPLIATAGENTDSELFSDENLATFYAQTQGVIGVHGLTYSDSVNSRIYGGALVAFRDPDDDSQDLVFSRFYFPSSQQLLKPLGGQVAITWPITFG